jgi:NAD(P)-dependent dehydrogenase (short-subunit alcohol dehydrogenase family)
MITLTPSSIFREFAEHCSGTGVTVNTVVPGPMRTESVKRIFENLAHEAGKTVLEVEQDYLVRAHPEWSRNRFIEPAELAPIVAYVCSSPAAALTGATLRLS